MGEHILRGRYTAKLRRECRLLPKRTLGIPSISNKKRFIFNVGANSEQVLYVTPQLTMHLKKKDLFYLTSLFESQPTGKFEIEVEDINDALKIPSSQLPLRFSKHTKITYEIIVDEYNPTHLLLIKVVYNSLTGRKTNYIFNSIVLNRKATFEICEDWCGGSNSCMAMSELHLLCNVIRAYNTINPYKNPSIIMPNKTIPNLEDILRLLRRHEIIPVTNDNQNDLILHFNVK